MCWFEFDSQALISGRTYAILLCYLPEYITIIYMIVIYRRVSAYLENLSAGRMKVLNRLKIYPIILVVLLAFSAINRVLHIFYNKRIFWVVIAHYTTSS